MATNRADTLDPALLRPGRLDRKIEFPRPSRREKRLIFQTVTGKMNLGPDVDLEDCERFSLQYEDIDEHVPTRCFSTRPTIISRHRIHSSGCWSSGFVFFSVVCKPTLSPISCSEKPLRNPSHRFRGGVESELFVWFSRNI